MQVYWVVVHLILFGFNYLINRIQKKVNKSNSKKLKKARQSSKTDVSDLKLECAKMFLMNFCQHGSNFGRKIQPILEYVFRGSDKNTPVSSFRSLQTKY